MSFRRERFLPKGGPNGGNGGHGGDVVLVVDPSLNTLADYRYQRHFKGAKGKHGRGRSQDGRKGNIKYLKIPPGTMVFDKSCEQCLTELTLDNPTFTIAAGGKGGRGNRSFKNSTNQAPRHATLGEEGDELVVLLQMRLVANVGLVGLPNAGKSTLLNAITSSQSKVGSYSFTTLYPSLGVVNIGAPARDDLMRPLVVADVPGLISGAHEGKGLGVRFLHHVEQCRIVAVIVSADHPHPIDEGYRVPIAEMEAFSPSLATKPRVVVLSKTDTRSDEDTALLKKKLAEISGVPVFSISTWQHEGLEEMVDAWWQSYCEMMPNVTPSDQMSGALQRIDNDESASAYTPQLPAWHP